MVIGAPDAFFCRDANTCIPLFSCDLSDSEMVGVTGIEPVTPPRPTGWR